MSRDRTMRPLCRYDLARSILSLGMFAARAFKIAVRSRELEAGSPPPILADMEISLMNLVNSCPRFASAAPLACLIVAHLLCPVNTLIKEDELEAVINYLSELYAIGVDAPSPLLYH